MSSHDLKKRKHKWYKCQLLMLNQHCRVGMINVRGEKESQKVLSKICKEIDSVADICMGPNPQEGIGQLFAHSVAGGNRQPPEPNCAQGISKRT